MKKCMDYGVEGSRPRDRPKRTWREVVQNDCESRKLNRADAMNCSRCRKLIKDGCDTERCEWMNVSSGTG